MSLAKWEMSFCVTLTLQFLPIQKSSTPPLSGSMNLWKSLSSFHSSTALHHHNADNWSATTTLLSALIRHIFLWDVGSLLSLHLSHIHRILHHWLWTPTSHYRAPIQAARYSRVHHPIALSTRHLAVTRTHYRKSLPRIRHHHLVLPQQSPWHRQQHHQATSGNSPFRQIPTWHAQGIKKMHGKKWASDSDSKRSLPVHQYLLRKPNSAHNFIPIKRTDFRTQFFRLLFLSICFDFSSQSLYQHRFWVFNVLHTMHVSSDRRSQVQFFHLSEQEVVCFFAVNSRGRWHLLPLSYVYPFALWCLLSQQFWPYMETLATNEVHEFWFSIHLISCRIRIILLFPMAWNQVWMVLLWFFLWFMCVVHMLFCCT